jgi:hypothetical protein
MKTELPVDLRKKIRRRAKRAFEAYDVAAKPKPPCTECGRPFDEPEDVYVPKRHRITEVKKKSLKYRVKGSVVGKSGLRRGPKITVTRGILGRITVPKEVETDD